MRNPLGMLLNRVPVPFSSAGQSSLGGLTGVGRQGQLSLLSLMGVDGTLFSIVNKTSTATASVDWHLHRKRPAATCDVCGEKNVENVERHPSLVVLNKPNDFHTRQELVEAGQQHIDIVGEGWTVIGRTGSMPAELWNVRPDRMTVVTSPSEFILGYIYRGPSGEEVPLKREDVLMIRMPNPVDPHRGMGPVQTIAITVNTSRYSKTWNQNFFINGARPGGAVKVKKSMTDTEWRRFQERWSENHRGVGNSHRVAILEGEAEWVDMKFTQRDMQMVELARLDKETIREAFGIPKFAVGDLEDVNRATAEAAKAWFAESLTVPRLDRWQGLLNNDFLPQFPGYDPSLSFVYTSPVPADREADREDRKSKVESFVALVNAGVNPDDAAEFLGLPPMRVDQQKVGATA